MCLPKGQCDIILPYQRKKHGGGEAIFFIKLEMIRFEIVQRLSLGWNDVCPQSNSKCSRLISKGVKSEQFG